ncbi:MAG: hypothetical protein AAB546_01700 [Patescibacteria group bacterium]
MINWNVDEEKFKKSSPYDYRLWKLVQLVNYGLGEDEKLNKTEIKKVWSKIEGRIDPYKKRAMEFLLWGRLYSLPNNLNFWNAFPVNHQ